MKKVIWIGIVISTIVLGFTAGIIVNIYESKKLEKATIEQVQQVKEINKNIENQIVVETSSNEEKTSPNATITFETYFNKCGHSYINKEKIKNDEVNKTKEEFEKLYTKWQIKEFNSGDIKLYREENGICDNHYMIREKDGHITIFSIDKDGNEKLKKETDITTQYLPERDNELLQNGIKVNSEKELEEVLSDYE